jgi:hypothetical protein
MPELTRRYIVMAMAAEGPFDLRDPDGAFVLKPWKDPAALRALAVYRDACYPELAVELGAWIEAISAGPRVRGGVGARNEQHMTRPAAARPKPVSTRRPPSKAKLKVVKLKRPKKRAKR